MLGSLGSSLVGSLFGDDTAAKQRQQQLDLANKAYGESSQYRQQAAPGYQALQAYGQGQQGLYNANLPVYQNAFNQAAGLPTTQNATQANPNPSPGYRQPSGGTAPAAPASQPQQAQQNNPYQLTQPQQEQLNGQVDTLAKQHQTALANFRARLSAQGITDPRALAAGEQQLGEQFSGLSNQAQAKFAEDARAQREAAAKQMLDYFANAGAQGTQAYAEGTNGIAGLGQQALGASSVAQNGANSAGYFAQQQQQQQNALSSGLSQLIGYALSGGFNKPAQASVPGIAPSNTQANPYNGQIGAGSSLPQSGISALGYNPFMP